MYYAPLRYRRNQSGSVSSMVGSLPEPLSMVSACFSNWRTRSRVTPSSLPTSSSVRGRSSMKPNLSASTMRRRGGILSSASMTSSLVSIFIATS